MDLSRPHSKGPHLQRTIQRITQAHQICAKNNPKTEHTPEKKAVEYKELCPFEDQQVDFTQIPKTRESFKFLFIFMGTFSGWLEANPPELRR